MSYIVAELEADVLMELNHKQTEQIHGGSEKSLNFEFSDEQLEEIGRQIKAVLEKYKDDDCRLIFRDTTKLNEPWSVDHYICYDHLQPSPSYGVIFG